MITCIVKDSYLDERLHGNHLKTCEKWHQDWYWQKPFDRKCNQGGQLALRSKQRVIKGSPDLPKTETDYYVIKRALQGDHKGKVVIPDGTRIRCKIPTGFTKRADQDQAFTERGDHKEFCPTNEVDIYQC